ncbi:kinase-like domain-containing protein [Absidia repens]|uniref:cAMP-dependent protein kinase n=1 Tax=Absidia repens TaxID=90262 RepID=A0A1X2II39_9FUNG|nr:kinase-like domain-containing protein [Absidia repens]
MMRWFCCFNQVQPDEPQNLDHFTILKIIGEGAFSQVRLVRHKKTGQHYALKIISKEKCIRRRYSQYIVGERQLMEQLSYPLISNMKYAFQDEDQLYMAMDFMPKGDLRQWLTYHHPSPPPFTELQLRSLIAQVILSIHYLHQRNVCHRDIKPENLMFDANGHVHLGDFSVATIFETNHPLKWSKAGSLAYFSPEMISQQGYTTAIDWWSLGVVAFELFFAKRPFLAPSNELLMKSILYQPLIFPKNAYGRISNQCLDFISGLLQKSPNQRLNGYDGSVFNHPWFEGLDWPQLEQKKQPSPVNLALTSPSNVPPQLHISPSSTEQSSATSKRYSRPISMDVSFTNKTARPVTEEAQMREWLEEAFLPFDCHQSPTFGVTNPFYSFRFLSS